MQELIASGRTADVFAAGPDRVLRRYRIGLSTEREAETMRYLGGLGYPVPVVYEATGTDMLMERIDGPTMVEALAAGDVSLDDGFRILADLHTTLHALPSRTGGESVLHLDLHPENVIMAARGPVVIDWENATEGPADLDVALSALILAEVSVHPDHPSAPLAGEGLKVFLSHAGLPRPEMIERAVEMRTQNPSLSTDEKSRLSRAASLIRA